MKVVAVPVTKCIIDPKGSVVGQGTILLRSLQAKRHRYHQCWTEITLQLALLKISEIRENWTDS